jgi:hypothetical protein
VKSVLEKHLNLQIDLEKMYSLEDDRDFKRVMATLQRKEAEGQAKV